MKARLSHGWRLAATGMSFVVFGVCGLLFSVLVFRSEERRVRERV